MRLLRFVQYKSRIDPDTGVVEGGALHTRFDLLSRKGSLAEGADELARLRE